MIDHGYIFGDANRVVRGQHNAELSNPQPFRPHPDKQVEQNGIVGHFEAFDVEMMLRKADRVVTERICELRLRRHSRSI
jgi:hypothetical protein